MLTKRFDASSALVTLIMAGSVAGYILWSLSAFL